MLLTSAVVFFGCGREIAPSHEDQPTDLEIKELVSKAAGMSPETFRKLAHTNAENTDRVVEEIPSKSLSLWLGKVRVMQERGDEDFMRIGHPDPADLAGALIGGRRMMKGEEIDYASYIRPAYITDLDWERNGDTISGTVKFSVPDVYSGRTRFVMSKKDSGWVVTQLSMPLRGVTFRLNAEGNWYYKMEQ
jgi:hypothetical protein